MPSESWKFLSLTLPALLKLFLIISLSALAGAQNRDCTSNGNYTSNSTYEANLNTVLSSLPSNITDGGFSSASVGQSPDRVNALALCRTDRTLDQCVTCVRNAAEGLVQFCPNRMQAIVWYEYCMLRYSNEPILGIPTNDGRVPVVFNTGNVLVDPVRFTEDWTGLVDELGAVAANGSSVVKGGGGSRNTTGNETIYGLVQCTPDLMAEDCRSCLNRGVQVMLGVRNSSRGMRAVMASCNVGYDLVRFYNETRLQEMRVLFTPPPPPPVSSPPPPSPPPPVSSPPPVSPPPPGNITTLIVVPIVVCLLLLAACAAIYLIRKRRMERRSQGIPENADDISTVESLQYDFAKIKAATNDFAEATKLGQGGFGSVYKGRLQNGQEIAVKRLSMDSGQGNMEFKNEVLLMARLQHRNLVRLLGFSIEGTERLLIYELVKNASLDHFIFDPEKRSHLDWDKRYQIIGGIARGLLYLHEDSQLRIIHRDLKPSNVLLDGAMNPKIADFGTARLFGHDETQGSTSKIVGTYGYMSPEYALHGLFSVKSDVFSFGVLLLEIMSGKRNNYIQRGENTEDLLTFTWKNWREGNPEKTIDPVLRAGKREVSLRDMLRCIHIGLLCVQENAANRPTMASILLMLSSSTITLSVPSEPAFFMASRFGPDVSLSDSGSTKAPRAKTAVSEGSSQNELSITELYPR